jgi:hypothetical protein
MKIRSYISGDEKEIMELDARELPSRWNPRTLENWYWKFTGKNPSGHALIWVAEHESHLVGHFAAVPYRLNVFGEVVTASHTIGALVDKKFQKRGLLKFVGDRLMEELAQSHIPYTWGFPNKLAHKFENVTFGYNDLLNFDEWGIEKAFIKKTSSQQSIRQVREFDQSFDRLWETCSPGYEIAVVRNRDYLNWRYLQRPDWEYFPFAYYEDDILKGYVVLKLYREDDTFRGHIIDIFARRDDEPVFSALIDHALSFFSAKAVDEVTVWIWGNPLVEALFPRKGFIKKEIDRPLILRVNLEHRHREKVKDKTHWYFTMGDSTEIF